MAKRWARNVQRCIKLAKAGANWRSAVWRVAGGAVGSREDFTAGNLFFSLTPSHISKMIVPGHHPYPRHTHCCDYKRINWSWSVASIFHARSVGRGWLTRAIFHHARIAAGAGEVQYYGRGFHYSHNFNLQKFPQFTYRFLFLYYSFDRLLSGKLFSWLSFALNDA